MFQVKKEGSNQNILVSDFRKMFARQNQKYNFIGEDCKTKSRKTRKLVHNVKSMTTSIFECEFVLRIGFIVKAYCSMFSVGLIHCN